MNLSSWFIHTVQVASVTGSLDAYGKATYAAPRAVKCRHERQNRRVTSSTGVDTVSNDVIYTSEPLRVDDRIWLPGFNSAQVEGSRKPLAVKDAVNKWGSQRLVRADL